MLVMTYISDYFLCLFFMCSGESVVFLNSFQSEGDEMNILVLKWENQDYFFSSLWNKLGYSYIYIYDTKELDFYRIYSSNFCFLYSFYIFLTKWCIYDLF